MDVLRPLSTGVSGAGARTDPRHPATRYASTPGIHPIIPHQNNKHAFHAKPTSFCSYRIPRIHQDRRARGYTLVTRSFPRGVLREKREKGEGGRRNSRRSCEMLLMSRGQEDKHTRETSSCRFVPVFVSSRAVTQDERRKTLIWW